MAGKQRNRTDLRSLIQAAGSDIIGQRIRRLRTERGLSIRELADQAMVSKNTLLRIEQGLNTHTNTLVAICKALRVKTTDLVGTTKHHEVLRGIHRQNDDVWYDMNTFKGGGVDVPLDTAEVLGLRYPPTVTPFCHLRSQVFGDHFNPNMVYLTSPTPRRSHRGEEFVFVIEGQLRLMFEESEVVLGPDESCLFSAAEMHHYEPVTKGELVRLLSIIIDPFPTHSPRLHLFASKSE